jgi:hypothetical protein
MGKACGRHGRDDKCLYGFGWKTVRNEDSSNSQA